MKIIQVNASYKPAYIYGGPALSVSRLCEGLVQQGTDLEVLTTTANGLDELHVEKNVPVLIDGVKVTYFKRLTKDHTHFSPALLNALKKKIITFKRTSQDLNKTSINTTNLIVHIHAWWNLVSVFSCMIAKWKNTPVVLTPRGTLSNYSFGNRNVQIKNFIHRFLGKSLLQYCHFHVTSEKEKEDILKLIHPRSIQIIPNFVFLPELKDLALQQSKKVTIENADLSIQRDNFFKLLFLSRIEEKKGLEILFNALSKTSFNFILSIAGSGNEEYIENLKQLSKELNIDHCIQWIGQKDQQEKWSIMENHDLLVLTSYDENFANVVIECLSTGTAVLISDKVGLADYIKLRDFGWICKTMPESVIDELEKANTNREKLSRIRNESPIKVRSDFEETRLIKLFQDMYSSIN